MSKRGLNELWETNDLAEVIGQLNNKEENEMNNNVNNATKTQVNPEEEITMNNTNNVGNNGLWEEISQLIGEASECFDEIGVDNEISIMSDEEWDEWVKEVAMNKQSSLKESVCFDNEEENKMNENIDIKELVSMGADPEEVKALVDLLNEIDQEILINKRKSQKALKMIRGETTETTVNEGELTMEELNKIKSKNEQAVASGFAMMLKSFEDEDADTKVNPEEENEVNNKTNNTASCNEIWEEITMETVVEETAEAEIKGGGLDASSLIDKVAGFKEVTAEKVSVLKEAASEKVSQAKATIENVDEDNEYYQKGVEVTNKAKEKYNKVLGSVFNRLKL